MSDIDDELSDVLNTPAEVAAAVRTVLRKCGPDCGDVFEALGLVP